MKRNSWNKRRKVTVKENNNNNRKNKGNKPRIVLM